MEYTIHNDDCSLLKDCSEKIFPEKVMKDSYLIQREAQINIKSIDKQHVTNLKSKKFYSNIPKTKTPMEAINHFQKQTTIQNSQHITNTG